MTDGGSSRGMSELDSSVDDVLRALADRRRRQVMDALGESTGEVPVDELASRLASDTDMALSNVEGGLHHCHLPILSEAGLVDYDPDSGAVSAETPEQVDELLDMIDRAFD